MSGDQLDFLQGNRETLTGTLHDPAATTGDVLTVQADKSIAARPGGGGGGAGSVRVLSHDFDFTQAAALSTGVTVWTPAAGDWLLNAWFESDTPGWTADGMKAAKADIGVITAGAWANLAGAPRGFFGYQVGPVDLSAAAWDVDVNYDTYPSQTVATDLVQVGVIAGLGNGYFPPQARMLTTDPISLVVSDDGNPGSAAFDGSAGASTLYLMVSSPVTTP